MRRTNVLGLTTVALVGAAIASCNFTLGVDRYVNTGGASSSSGSTSTGTGPGGDDAGKGGKGGAPPQGGNAVWSQSFGGTGATLTVTGLAADMTGNLYLTGALTGSVTFGGQCSAALSSSGVTVGYLLKLDPKGSCLWATTFGSTMAGASTRGAALAVDGNGVITLAGVYAGSGLALPGTASLLSAPVGQDSFVVRYPVGFDPGKATPMASWLQHFGPDGNQVITALSVDTGGNVYVGGSYTTTLTVMGLVLGGGMGQTGFAVLLGSADGAPSMQASAISTDTSGDAVVRDVSFGGGVVAVAGKSSGGLNYGKGDFPGHVGNDAFMLTYNSQLASPSSWLFGDTNEQEADCVVINSNAELYLAGSFSGTIDFAGGAKVTTATPSATNAFIAHLSPTGEGLQATKLGTVDTSNPLAGLHLALLGDGEVVFAGTLSGDVSVGGETASAMGGNDVVVGRLDSKLSQAAWLHAYGGDDEQGADAVVLANGQIVIAGHFHGSLDLGNHKALTALGTTDLFVAQLLP